MATKKPKGLGLGLEALLGPTVRQTSESGAGGGDGEPHTLAIDRLQPGKYQPRMHIDEAGLNELAESIKAQGVMQPVLVRRLGGAADRFEIIAGERRVRAARLAGLEQVPVLVRDVPDEAAAAMALIENMQREDLNPLEEARGVKRLTEEFGLTHEAAARALGRSRSATTNLLRLLQLSEPVQQLLLGGAIEMGHARALLPLGGAEQIQAANEIVAKGLNVREAEKLAARQAAGSAGSSPLLRAKRQKSSDILRLERQLSDSFATTVEIRLRDSGAAKGHRGEVAIAFGSLDELDGLLGKFGHERS
ncbi:MAG: ParB/RepB/Spo0J family partition protein [Burkholderiales bacterium]|nr:ParB/RepB/Spo0J family partition protein [Burkholderiales bacterium]